MDGPLLWLYVGKLDHRPAFMTVCDWFARLQVPTQTADEFADRLELSESLRREGLALYRARSQALAEAAKWN